MEYNNNDYLHGVKCEEKEFGQIKAQGQEADSSVYLLILLISESCKHIT